MISSTTFLLWLGLSVASASAFGKCEDGTNKTYNDPCCCNFCNNLQNASYDRVSCLFKNWTKYAPTHVVSKGSKPVNVLRESTRSDKVKNYIEGFNFTDIPDFGNYTIHDTLRNTHSDAFIAMHKGKVVYEWYWEQAPSTHHIVHSCSKSYIALTAAMIAHNYKNFDPNENASEYFPELNLIEAFQNATVRHFMDMTVAVKFNEMDYGPNSDSTKFNNLVYKEGFTKALMEYMKPHENRRHGEVFNYCSPNTNVLGYILDEFLGEPGAALNYFQTEVWSKLGQEHDLLWSSTVPSWSGPAFPMYSGGALATARDMARFGQMMINMGKSADGIQVVPEEVIYDIVRGGTKENIQQYDKSLECENPPCNTAYRNMFRVNVEDGTFYQLGVHGQKVWMDTRNNYVTVKQSSNPSSMVDTYWENFVIKNPIKYIQEEYPKSKKSKQSKASKSSKGVY